MVWTYFRTLRGIAQRVDAIQDPTEQKDEVVLSLVMAVAAVEVFVNVFFRVLVEEAPYQVHRDLVLSDLEPEGAERSRSLTYKLRNWPPKVLGKSLNWQKGIAADFARLCDRRNALMHFRSSSETLSVGNAVIEGLARTAVYDDLKAADAVDAARIAEGMVAEILRLRGVSTGRMAGNLHGWTGKLP